MIHLLPVSSSHLSCYSLTCLRTTISPITIFTTTSQLNNSIGCNNTKWIAFLEISLSNAFIALYINKCFHFTDKEKHFVLRDLLQKTKIGGQKWHFKIFLSVRECILLVRCSSTDKRWSFSAHHNLLCSAR